MFVKKRSAVADTTTTTPSSEEKETTSTRKKSLRSLIKKKAEKNKQVTDSSIHMEDDDLMDLHHDDESKETTTTTSQTQQQQKKNVLLNDNLTSILFGGYKSSISTNNNNNNSSSSTLLGMKNGFDASTTMTDDELFGVAKNADDEHSLRSEIEQQEDSDLFFYEKPSIQTRSIMEEDEEGSQAQHHHDRTSSSKRATPILRLKPAWEDVYTKELRIANDYDEEEDEVDMDGIAQSIIKGFLKRDRESAVISGEQYEKKMRKIYSHLCPAPQWAKLKVAQIESELEDGTKCIREVIMDEHNFNGSADDMLQRSSESAIVQSKTILDRFKLSYQKLNDMNAQERVGQVFSLAFHPKLNIAAVLNSDKKIRLFTVDGELNPILDRLQITNQGDNNLRNIMFTKDGKSLLSFLEKSAYFLITDLDTGKTRRTQKLFSRRTRGDEKEGGKFLLHNAVDVSSDNKLIAIADDIGSILLISRKTLNIKHIFTANISQVTCVNFSEDCKSLFVTGKGGKVFVFDVESEKVKHIFTDHGSIHTNFIAVSPDMQYIATGSTSGAVNLYRWNDVFNSQSPKPLTTFMNLTTSVDMLRFTADSQLLMFASTEKSNAFRFAHLASLYVYSNFPGEMGMKKQYSYNCLAMSSTSEFLALGCQSGPVILFQLPYYSNK
ncbi:hypothetical protein C9374_010097 [Naegleria lovaniensis]|uniref:WD40 repeat-containing protein n=1 Tax=Naegleria lovaniensis TaxID=51637 RepID=A0AA88KEK4_NAELO|nr:uncharacterized protein C9374_010097 [Naegleria lovaniensis]KAG2375093.1 hypothetical protein C9374_010097 [Naegleria lovaniensis]